jgi:hypothetical protein
MDPKLTEAAEALKVFLDRLIEKTRRGEIPWEINPRTAEDINIITAAVPAGTLRFNVTKAGRFWQYYLQFEADEDFAWRYPFSSPTPCEQLDIRFEELFDLIINSGPQAATGAQPCVADHIKASLQLLEEPAG